jgi:hypothetical protein
MGRSVEPALETVVAYRARTLREREAKARALQGRFAQVSRPWDRGLRRTLGRAGRGLLVVYWLGCLAVLGAGANKLYPEAGARVAELLQPFAGALAPELLAGPAARALWGFPNCEAAHRAGVYDIPRDSRAYDPRQDRDRDGFACETYPGDPYVGRRSAP